MSGIKVLAESANPGNIEVRVTVTMMVSEWETVLQHLRKDQHHPIWIVANGIREAIEKFTDAHHSVAEYSE